MTTEERVNQAFELMRIARQHVIAATESPDPVEERRQLVEAAALLRQSAGYLDDEGRIT